MGLVSVVALLLGGSAAAAGKALCDLFLGCVTCSWPTPTVVTTPPTTNSSLNWRAGSAPCRARVIAVAASSRRAARLVPRRRVVAAVVERLYTIPVTCCLDGQAHEVTDASVAAGRGIGGMRRCADYAVVPSPGGLRDGLRCCHAESGW
jgi:hypothetical protein